LNLGPSATKALNRYSIALGFQVISNFWLGSAKFVVTNKVIFVRKYYLKKLTTFYTRY